MNEPWNLAVSTYREIKASAYEVAVIPFGATEPHNLHLPYATDTLEATVIGEHLCREAHRQGAKIVLLPTLPYGTETNMRGFPFALNLNPSTLYRVATDLIQSLAAQGIRKILLLNSHGGNDLKPLLRELSGSQEAHLFLCNWYQVINDCYFDVFEKGEDHAGEMETSFALAYFPQWVHTDEEGQLMADDGAKATSRFDALEQGWVSITRPWHLLTRNSGAADPHAATAEKGEQLMRILEQRLVPFLVELSQSELDDNFPY